MLNHKRSKGIVVHGRSRPWKAPWIHIGVNAETVQWTGGGHVEAEQSVRPALPCSLPSWVEFWGRTLNGKNHMYHNMGCRGPLGWTDLRVENSRALSASLKVPTWCVPPAKTSWSPALQ